MKKLLPWVIFFFGLLLDLGGLALAGMYVIEAVIRRLGEPDQSLLFWYLPILLAGLICLLIGIAATFVGFTRLRKSAESLDDTDQDNLPG